MNPGKVVKDPSVNEPSHYIEDMELRAQAQQDPYSQETSTQESSFGFPNVSTSETRDPSLMQIKPSQFGKEANVSEIENVGLQIKRLEKELDNIFDTDVGEEEPTVVKVSRTYKSSKTSKADKLYKGFSPDDENDDDFLDYNEAIRNKAFVRTRKLRQLEHFCS